MRTLIRFLGGIYLALFLIATTAAWVIAGTFIEAATDSHAQAASWTYGNPLFLALLGGYFINILVSALRRWPYRPKHIPFLITHLGLLMVLTGTIIKVTCGVQGVMGILEGSASHHIFLPGTEALHIQWSDRTEERPIDDNLKILGRSEHCKETLEAWIKGDTAVIRGLPPVPVMEFKPYEPLTAGYQGSDWQVIALRTPDVEAAVRATFLQVSEITWPHGTPDSWELQLTLSSSHEVEEACLSWTHGRMPLMGPDAGTPENTLTPWLGGPAFTPQITTIPTLLIVQDGDHNDHLFFMNRRGAVFSTSYRCDSLSNYIAYDNGFSGYATSIELPPTQIHPAFQDPEGAHLHALADQLKDADDVSLPLQILRDACGNESFLPTCLDFLQKWDRSGRYLYAGTLPPLNLSEEIRKGTRWIALLMDEMLPRLGNGESLVAVLDEMRWPLVSEVRTQSATLDNDGLLMLLCQQILSVAPQLPDPSPLGRAHTDEELLSALFQAYGIHLRLLRGDTLERMLAASHLKQVPRFELECPLTRHHQDLPAPVKIEDRIPRITLDWEGQPLSLAFDRYGSGFKWPTPDGKALVRYQPKFQSLPYTIRLRDTRKIDYAGSNQPYSYESDLIVTDRRTGKEEEVTISMNNVYETNDGYRFYMANIVPDQEIRAKQAQLVVSRDPAKWWFTYPGAIILSLGIVLLFSTRRRA